MVRPPLSRHRTENTRQFDLAFAHFAVDIVLEIREVINRAQADTAP